VIATNIAVNTERFKSRVSALVNILFCITFVKEVDRFTDHSSGKTNSVQYPIENQGKSNIIHKIHYPDPISVTNEYP